MNELIAVGHGNTADVYEWQGDDVLKLFNKAYEGNVDKEFNIAQQIVKTGLRVPMPKSKITYDGRQGIIYERIRGADMLSVMAKQPDNIDNWGQLFAEIHYQVHSYSAPSLSSPRAELNHLIETCDILSLEVRKSVLTIFHELEDGTTLCHGDFHPLNIMITDDGPVIIDWMNSKSFHPLADVALSSIILQVATGLPEWAQTFHDSYIKRYFHLSSFDYISLARWQIPMAVARLRENKEEERDGILNLIEKNLRLVSMSS